MSDAVQLHAGDVVRLKSGGPAMTVEVEPRTEEVIRLIWFSPNGELHAGQVDSAASLEPTHPDAWP